VTSLLPHEAASVLYAVAAFIGFRGARRGYSPRAVAWVMFAAVLPHAWGFVWLHGQDPPVSLSSFPAALSLIGLLVPVSFLLSLRIVRVREVGAWVAALSALLTAIAAAGLRFSSPIAASEAETGALSHAHVLLSTLGFSLLALSSVAGVAYLAKKRALKGKSPARFALPSLESLDRMAHFTLTFGYPLLTLGVVSGFVWGIRHGYSPWSGHTLWLLVAWVVYLLPIGMRVIGHQHGDRPARGAVLGFALLAFAYIGIRLLGGAA
jgi:ABC-type uncharacterized transport system permease subunit